MAYEINEKRYEIYKHLPWEQGVNLTRPNFVPKLTYDRRCNAYVYVENTGLIVIKEFGSKDECKQAVDEHNENLKYNNKRNALKNMLLRKSN